MPNTKITPGQVRPVPGLGNRGEFDSVIVDLVESQRIGDSLLNGSYATRTFLVTGLDSNTTAGKLAVAMRAPGIPKIGDYHPEMRTLPVLDVYAEPKDGQPDTAMVTVEYAFPQGGGGIDFPPDNIATVEVVSTVTPAETNFDVGGNPLAVSYIIEDDEAGTSTLDEQIATASKQVPTASVIFRRRESRSPGLFSANFVGHVNLTDVFDDEPRTWLCTRIDGRSEDGGLTYNVTYEFQRSPNAVIANVRDSLGQPILPAGRNTQGWDAVVLYEDAGGNTPLGVKAGEGVNLYNIYPAVEFRDLEGLPFG